MRRFIIFATFLLLYLTVKSQDSIFYFHEDFENGINPEAWAQDPEIGNINWRTQNGGHTTTSTVPGSGHPPYAFQGVKNALFQYESPNNETTILITPKINLEFALKPKLKFRHAQQQRYYFGEYKTDHLTILYKNNIAEDWIVLEEYKSPTPDNVWIYRETFLPDTLLGSSCYIGFKATTNIGWGVCLDSIAVVETDVATRVLDTLTACQPYTNYIASGTKDNPLLRIDLRVEGNTNNLLLQKLKLKSLSTHTPDFISNGVKLFYTRDSVFDKKNNIHAGASFVNDTLTFSNINFKLPTGYSSLWITVDIDDSAAHTNVVDLMLEAGSVMINNQGYPQNPISPAGNRMLYQTIFKEDFESNTPWVFTSEFERGMPQGLGGQPGNADPDFAFSGDSVIGTDLYGHGVEAGKYEDSIPDRAYMAVSPTFPAYYFKDIKLNFKRWLNVYFSDKVFIDISPDSGNTWINTWTNSGTITDEDWVDFYVNVADYAERAEDLQIRFALGPTVSSWNFSGWNIDDVYLTGDYITQDAATVERLRPRNGTGHTSAEDLTFVVKNSGAKEINAPIPMMCKLVDLDTNVFIAYDTIKRIIAPNDTIHFTFSTKLNLDKPNIFYDIVSSVSLGGDEYVFNDTLISDLYVLPTFNVPYREDFEKSRLFWLVNGTDKGLRDASSWELGFPSGDYISGCASDSNCWVTVDSSTYKKGDSSFVVSPFFDFSGADVPYIEFSLAYHTENGMDGVQLQYSVDNNKTWKKVGFDTLPYNWNWYNSPVITALGDTGWSGYSTGWIKARQLLPAEVKDSLVQFRFMFASDPLDWSQEGFAFDDFVVSDAPHDLGVTSIVFPWDTCDLGYDEKVVVKIHNYGIRKVKAGDTLIVGLSVNDSAFITDTTVIATDIPIGAEYQYTFEKGADLHLGGTYHLEAFTMLPEDKNIYSNVSYNNDSAFKTILVKKPYVNFGPDIFTVSPDTVFLNASAGSGNNYLWHNNSVDSVFDVLTEGKYWVRVKNSTTGCIATDTILVKKVTADLQLVAIVSPDSACSLYKNTGITVHIKNAGDEVFYKNRKIVMEYAINGGAYKKDTLALAANLLPQGVLSYTYKTASDMSNPQMYKLFCRLSYAADVNKLNDTVTKFVKVHGKPYFELEPDDTIHRALHYTINASAINPSLVAYHWQDNTTGPVYNIDYPAKGYYAVTVTDANGCQNHDSIFVYLAMPDIRLSAIANPADKYCGEIFGEYLFFRMQNIGNDTIKKGEKIRFSYQFNTLPRKYDTLTINSHIRPKDSVNLYLPKPLFFDIPGNYQLKLISLYPRDSIYTNDTTLKNLTIFSKPPLDLGGDVTVKSNSHTLDAGEGFLLYQWNLDTANSRYFEVTSALAKPFVYVQVTVTDTNYCSSTDQARVTLNFVDIEATSFNIADTLCGIDADKPLKLTITNKGTSTLTDNEVTIKLKVNNALVKQENFEVYDYTKKYINQDQSFDYTLEPTGYLGEKGFYVISLEAFLSEDIVTGNNTLTGNHYIIGLPVLDWGTTEDTLYKSLPAQISISGAGTYNYLWNTGATGTTATISYPIKAKVTATDVVSGCSTSASIYVASASNVADIGSPDDNVRIYPNPFSSSITIEHSFNPRQQYHAEVYDMLGKRVQQTILRKNPLTINLSHLPAGSYMLIIKAEQEMLYKTHLIKNEQ